MNPRKSALEKIGMGRYAARQRRGASA